MSLHIIEIKLDGDLKCYTQISFEAHTKTGSFGYFHSAGTTMS